jgi:hypothetical protein
LLLSAQASHKPGEPLDVHPPYDTIQELARRKPSLQLPPGTNRDSVFLCRYQSLTVGATAPEIRYFWVKQPPTWLTSLPAGHPIRSLVKRAVGHCPESLAQAELTPEQLGPLWAGDDARQIMGGQNGGAVFASILEARQALGGKWVLLKGYKNVNDRSPKPALAINRLLTETEVIDMTARGLVVRPITYKEKAFCYLDPKRSGEVCEELLLHEAQNLAMGVVKGKSFDMYASVTILPAPPAGSPSPAQTAEARRLTLAEDIRVAERRAADGFLTKGLPDAQALIDLHDGNFDDVTIRPDSFFFGKLVHQYIRDFGAPDRCGSSLPRNAVPIMTAGGCRTEVRRVTGTQCIDYYEVPSGIKADPQLYSLSRKLGDALVGDALAKALAPPSGGSTGSPWQPLYDAMDRIKLMSVEEQAAVDEMQGIFDRNACGSPGLVRFQENMVRYAEGQSPILASGPVQH